MNFIKSALLITVCSSTLLVSAVAIAAPDAAFQAEKDRHIANLQERLQIVQKHLSCVQAAQDQAALKACREAAREDNKALRTKIKSQVAEKKAQKDAAKAAPPAIPAAPAKH